MALGLYVQTKTGVQQRQFTDLPWQIERVEDNRLDVLGFRLGVSKPADFVGRLPVPDIRLFVQPDGEAILEAFYVNARIEPFEANLVARLEWPDDQFEWLLSQRVSERPMPSGARRYGLSDAALSRMGDRPIIELSYVPRARWTADQLLSFFGPPSERLDLDRDQAYWLYPEKSTAIMVPRRGRVMMHYTSPDRFDDAVDRLAALAESRLEAGQLSDDRPAVDADPLTDAASNPAAGSHSQSSPRSGE
ncbi:MAG: hypothetical protein ACK4IT_05515 [Thioalkalivibrionaceae bacterium]